MYPSYYFLTYYAQCFHFKIIIRHHSKSFPQKISPAQPQPLNIDFPVSNKITIIQIYIHEWKQCLWIFSIKNEPNHTSNTVSECMHCLSKAQPCDQAELFKGQLSMFLCFFYRSRYAIPVIQRILQDKQVCWFEH